MQDPEQSLSLFRATLIVGQTVLLYQPPWKRAPWPCRNDQLCLHPLDAETVEKCDGEGSHLYLADDAAGSGTAVGSKKKGKQQAYFCIFHDVLQIAAKLQSNTSLPLTL